MIKKSAQYSLIAAGISITGVTAIYAAITLTPVSPDWQGPNSPGNTPTVNVSYNTEFESMSCKKADAPADMIIGGGVSVGGSVGGNA